MPVATFNGVCRPHGEIVGLMIAGNDGEASDKQGRPVAGSVGGCTVSAAGE